VTTLRLAAHIHSAFSDDCDWELLRISRQLRALGYDGALVCEHDRTMTHAKWRDVMQACDSASQSGFLLIPGIEYQDPTHVLHVPVYGSIPYLGRSRDVEDVIDHAQAYGGISVLAHPARRSAYQRFDEAWCPKLTGIEVWNRKYDGLRPNAWAVDIAREFGLQRFVSLDYHGPRQLFPLAIHVEIPGPVSANAVLEAIRLRGVQPRVLGMDPESALDGTLGKLTATAEKVRVNLAPKVRRIEDLIRRQ